MLNSGNQALDCIYKTCDFNQFSHFNEWSLSSCCIILDFTHLHNLQLTRTTLTTFPTASMNFNAAVATIQGAMGGVALVFMCITSSGLSNIIDCYNCNDVTRSQLQLLETWIIMCNDVKISGQHAALNCWHTNRNKLCCSLGYSHWPSFLLF
jgi:hypothetical protein